MADFHQNGNITTLHNLRTRSVAEMTSDLESFAQTRKMSLVLPCLYSELETDAMPRILDELSKVPYLHRIIIGLDRADEAQYRHAKEFFKGLNQNHIVIWNDSPRMLALGEKLVAMGLAPSEPGKGKNVWTSIGYLISCQDSAVMAIHDCDILTYTNEMLARLVYPVANVNFPYQLAKGYYARVGQDRLNGRVSRLLVSPLLIALKKVIGDRDYIDYLRSFRYPLSGEFAMRTTMLPDLRIPTDWGLEIGILSEAWRNLAPQAVCQVEIADQYDHKHQVLSEDDANAGLSRMSTDICKAIFRKLAADGTVFTPNVFRTLKATYYRCALDVMEAYYNDAKMNGLSIDRHKEERAIELFAENIMRAGQFFLDNPHETPFITTWNRVHSAEPDFLEELHAAAAADEAEYA
ncbi:glycosyl transferase [Sulfitobacter geojensis]|uniref:Glycosyl transferase n=1 Tax=Sulfitobacter geojensis TaxID=1342299 RepID=A0AAE2VYJ2_9RHOB|nr:glycosyl transferase [Sulfitobacter geojensis]MBM1689517.1 glycosyl transferase [Sulfitobacter geojensis]MBM1693583.1 glycosyl transferase [Sulfitobacter geojensis]MBM1705749.1 glycosyl transferase [Sulfitobacter geojensis]MBM1709807.1 glycosyl transferase [Sulfitobacter geojensis]MBM1713873.1 glycosyl transferase [Sulfitobacter geojensis]